MLNSNIKRKSGYDSLNAHLRPRDGLQHRLATRWKVFLSTGPTKRFLSDVGTTCFADDNVRGPYMAERSIVEAKRKAIRQQAPVITIISAPQHDVLSFGCVSWACVKHKLLSGVVAGYVSD